VTTEDAVWRRFDSFAKLVFGRFSYHEFETGEELVVYQIAATLTQASFVMEGSSVTFESLPDETRRPTTWTPVNHCGHQGPYDTECVKAAGHDPDAGHWDGEGHEWNDQ
jgi:hypothetical protein